MRLNAADYEFSTTEVAKIMGLTVNEVIVIERAALAKIAALLEERDIHL